MSKSTTYNIDYHSISEGISTLEFPITDELFELCGSPEIKRGAGVAIFHLNKNGHTATADVSLQAKVVSPCDRCLDEFTLDLEWTGRTVLKVTEHTGDYDGDIIYISMQNQNTDLAQYIYESIILALPIERAHDDITDCNPEIVKFISQE